MSWFFAYAINYLVQDAATVLGVIQADISSDEILHLVLLLA